MALESDKANPPIRQQDLPPQQIEDAYSREEALWGAVVALQHHALKNQSLLENGYFRSILDGAVAEWGSEFEALP